MWISNWGYEEEERMVQDTIVFHCKKPLGVYKVTWPSIYDDMQKRHWNQGKLQNES